MHGRGRDPRDVGQLSVGTRCADAAACRKLAHGPIFTVGKEPGLETARSLLHDVYSRKVGVFGGLVGVGASKTPS